MNQTKKNEQIKLRPENTNRRPKRCMICRKMFAVQKYVLFQLPQNEHVQGCSRAEQKKIEQSRQKERNARNVTSNKPIQMPTRKAEVQEKPARSSTRQGNRFRIKSMNNGLQSTQYKSKSVFVNNKKQQTKVQLRKLREVQQIKQKNQNKKEPNQRGLIASQSLESLHIEQEKVQKRQEQNQLRIQQNNPVLNIEPQIEQIEEIPVIPMRNVSDVIPRRLDSSEQQRDRNSNRQANQPTLIEARIQQVPERQQNRNYNIQELINNSNSIIEFIRSINILGEDETMSQMISQLQQLNLIAEQIVQLSSLGHVIGSTMGNIFAVRIHELQTVITNQIGIALIRGFNERLGAEFQGLIQMRPAIKEGFTQNEIDELFPEKVNCNRKECSICLDDMKPSDSIIELQCFHLFHPSCIREWLTSSRKCPMCRKVQQEIK